MRQGLRRQSPALAVAILALFVALGGSVYAAKRARINGKAIRAKSLPGNRLKPHTVPGNRLRPHSITAGLLQQGILPEIPSIPEISPSHPLTGSEINELTLGQVPSAAHADSADTAQNAVVAQTATNAIHAVDAQTVNGHGAGCLPGTQSFAGACWDSSKHDFADAPTAARQCAAHGGELPSALALAAFGEQSGVYLDANGEWSSNLMNFSGPNAYGVATVNENSVVNLDLSTALHHYRCVIPLVS